MKEKILIASEDDVFISQICAILKENNIPYIKNEGGAGEYMTVALGKNIGIDKVIVVSSEDYEKAQKLIEPIASELKKTDNEENLEELREQEDDSDMKKIVRYSKIKKYWALSIFGLTFLGIFLAIVAMIYG